MDSAIPYTRIQKAAGTWTQNDVCCFVLGVLGLCCLFPCLLIHAVFVPLLGLGFEGGHVPTFWLLLASSLQVHGRRCAERRSRPSQSDIYIYIYIYGAVSPCR